ncbi:flagellar protein FlgN [Alteribacter aurantiacus]|uniref:flagellar protein FlgN n=1 Tax=Alteribacter aurantiacus TaxID=254410 RepID=UPI0005500235|nr:flagellar protein FlgN [Alteribacter aurantiacus]
MAKHLIEALKDLTKLHERFNGLAKEKAEAVKKSEMKTLDEVLKRESALIQELSACEKKRQIATSDWLHRQGLVKENVTVEEMIPYLEDEEGDELRFWQQRLLEEIRLWKEQNELNEQLIHESLRFVNMSLDAFQPKQSENYARPNRGHSYAEERRSVFDSKA